MAEQFFFFYGNQRIVVQQETLTGLAIKEAIKAHDPSLDLSHELVLEGEGHDADQVISDTQPVELAVGHGDKPKKFFTRPPTNFGTS